MIRNKISLCATVALASLALLAPSQALATNIVSADFREELDLPSYGVGPRVMEALGRTVGAGYELTAADTISNPSGWNNTINLDLSTGDLSSSILDLTFTPDGYNDYQTFVFHIGNIVFGNPSFQIIGVSAVTDNLLDTPGAIRTISYTADSIDITYGVGQATQYFFQSGHATFDIQMASSNVPDSGATVALLGGALVAIAALRRRRTA